MNAQDKMNIIAPTAIRAFDDNLTLDEVCSDCVSIAIENGVAFSEILPLVKQIGRDNGYIVELSKRKANLVTDIAGLHGLSLPLLYSSLVQWVDELSKDYDVPETFALSALKDKLRNDGIEIPTKPQLSGWKLSALECWQDNDTRPDLQDVRRWLREDGHNHSLYTQGYHELFQALAAL
jgi:hypothetical protein